MRKLFFLPHSSLLGKRKEDGVSGGGELSSPFPSRLASLADSFFRDVCSANVLDN